MCRGCQKMISIGRAEVEAALGPLAEKHGFAPDYGHLTVFGTCADCLTEGEGH